MAETFSNASVAARGPDQAQPADSRSLVEKAFESIKGGVLSCYLEPGSLINASRLAESIGVSRTPVQEALKRLAGEGWVVARPHAGHIVAPLTITDVQQIYDLRLILETNAVEMAAEVATDQQVEELARAGHSPGAALSEVQPTATTDKAWMSSHPDDPWVQLHLAVFVHSHFHYRVAALTGNPHLIRMIVGLLEKGHRAIMLCLLKDPHNLDEWAGATDRHQQIVEALRSRNKAAAVSAVIQDIEEGFREIREVLLPAQVLPELRKVKLSAHDGR